MDKAGNKEKVQTVEVKIDKTAPITVSNVSERWSKEEVPVKLTATDELSGTAKTFYSINGSEYKEGTSFTVDREGVNEVSFYSVDKAGNKEEVQTVEVKIDKTAPVTASDVPETWSKEEVPVKLTATDKLSGADKTFYSVNGSEYKEGASFTVDKEGVNKVSFYSVDKAGNKEEIQSVEVKIDKTKPVVSWDLSSEYALGASFNLAYTAEDKMSGVASETLTLNGKTLTNGEKVILDQPGAYKAVVTVTDKAGWITTLEKTFTVYIPATIDVNPGIIKGNSGVFTVQVTVPKGFDTAKFDLGSAKVNAVSANTGTNGLVQQAKKGQFKFDRENFSWSPGKVKVEFRALLDGQLVIGSTTVEAK
ncbi:OmpL47-type beta-barrel domain-containing protein [Pseudobacillus wudalianchiensis]|uniref:Ig-like domain-containing protein n=1 Tax=Pseudobacillus wudalianchiensis TaxID=1743143 RepID=A0A1B9AYS8_9BACI|nr:Ig-like domain repeat protein [Bacillus wudalianchiensis]OCA89032.1 hypothetical protein A8F95_06355 [Bacillus wudalianchiensis]